MTPTERTLRSDAERNRRRVLNAAQELFRERGLDVGVAEIAQRAGVGRGTLFRNFPTKQDLIAAIVIDRMHEATAQARALLDAPEQVQQDWHDDAIVEGQQMLQLEHGERTLAQVVLRRVQQLPVLSCQGVGSQRRQELGVLELGRQLGQRAVRSRVAGHQ